MAKTSNKTTLLIVAVAVALIVAILFFFKAKRKKASEENEYRGTATVPPFGGGPSLSRSETPSVVNVTASGGSGGLGGESVGYGGAGGAGGLGGASAAQGGSGSGGQTSVVGPAREERIERANEIAIGAKSGGTMTRTDDTPTKRTEAPKSRFGTTPKTQSKELARTSSSDIVTARKEAVKRLTTASKTQPKLSVGKAYMYPVV